MEAGRAGSDPNLLGRSQHSLLSSSSSPSVSIPQNTTTQKKMATSMAAALAASIPSAQAAPTPSAPTHEKIPDSLLKVIDVEAAIPLASVQLDSLVVTKILKHSGEAAQRAQGLLLGLDLDGVLEVSNSFPLPIYSGEDEEKISKSTSRYQASMLRSLKEVQSDDSVVGFYQASPLGAFFKQTMIETQAIHQEKLRQGGVVILHDLSQATSGDASLRAFRLTKSFLDAYKKSNFSTAGLISHSLSFANILEELPVAIRTNALSSAFFSAVTQPPASQTLQTTPTTSTPSFVALDFVSTGITRSLEQISDAVEAYRVEEGNLAYHARQNARERAKVDAYIQKRKEENATRLAQGLPALPEEDVGRLFKIPPEPSRLESMLLLAQIDAYAGGLESAAGTGLLKMYAAKASAGI